VLRSSALYCLVSSHASHTPRMRPTYTTQCAHTMLPTNRIADEKAEKKLKADEKKAKKKAEGTYKTKKQKEQEARAKAALDAMAAAGMEVPSSSAAPTGGSKPRASASNNTKRKQQQQQSKVRYCCLCMLSSAVLSHCARYGYVLVLIVEHHNS
jgi:hypothetical protein